MLAALPGQQGVERAERSSFVGQGFGPTAGGTGGAGPGLGGVCPALGLPSCGGRSIGRWADGCRGSRRRGPTHPLQIDAEQHQICTGHAVYLTEETEWIKLSEVPNLPDGWDWMAAENSEDDDEPEDDPYVRPTA